jgi:flagellar hook-associated protein 3 FlgL
MTINSFLRLGTANNYTNSVANINARQVSLSTLQESLTSGLKSAHPADDPIGAAQAERAITRIARIQSDQKALGLQTDAITSAESTLGNAVSALQSFRQLVVSAGNATMSAADRQTVAQQLTSLRDQVFSLSNTTDANGNPLFGALGSALAPFVQQSSSPGTYTFNGIAGQTSSTAVSIPAALDGDKAFMFKPSQDASFNVSYSTNAGLSSTGAVTLQSPPTTVPTPNSSYKIQFLTDPVSGALQYQVNQNPAGPAPTPTNFTPGTPITFDGLSLTVTGAPQSGDTLNVQANTSIFGVMDKAISDIGSAPTSLAASQAVGQALSNIDLGINRLQAARGLAGDLMNRSDTIGTAQTAGATQAEADRSSAQDVNMVQAISDFQNQQTGFSAALQSYAQIQKLSLFNYIG